MGLFSSIAGYFGKKKLAKASKKAATAQVDALQGGINTVNTAQQQGLDAINTGLTGAETALTGATDANRLAIEQALAGLNPYQQQGTQAVDAQSDLLGLNGPERQAAALAGLEGGPVLQSILRGGHEDILQTASATGGLRGGNTISDLTDFRMDALSRVLTDQLGQLGGVANRGLSAAGTAADTGLTGAGLNSNLAGILAQLRSGNGQDIASLLGGNAETIASLLSGQGAAKAGGILGKAKYNAAALGDLASAAGSVASAFLPTGGFGGTVRGFI